MMERMKPWAAALAMAIVATTASIGRADDATARADVSLSADSGDAAAPPKEPIGILLGLGLGYALPAGNLERNAVTGQDEKLADYFTHGIPIALDAAYRLDPNIDIGVSGQYAILSTDAAQFGCGGRLKCSGSMIRLGLDARFHIRPDARLDPWVGLGIGYEWMHLGLSGGGGADQSRNATGFELAHVQLGANYAVAPRVQVGPVIALSLAQYQQVNSGGASSSILNKGLHEWWTIGVRGVYSL